jgi:hypothetical protein
MMCSCFGIGSRSAFDPLSSSIFPQHPLSRDRASVERISLDVGSNGSLITGFSGESAFCMGVSVFLLSALGDTFVSFLTLELSFFIHLYHPHEVLFRLVGLPPAGLVLVAVLLVYFVDPTIHGLPHEGDRNTQKRVLDGPFE